MPYTASEICDLLGGELVGEKDVVIHKPAKIENAQEGSISFISNPKYDQFLYTTKASVIIVSDDFKINGQVTSTLIRVKDPYIAFSKILEEFSQDITTKAGIESDNIASTAQIGTNVYIGKGVCIEDYVKIGNNVKIFANTYIGSNVQVGDNTVIYSGVNIYYDGVIGNDCTIHSGVVIGGDGFGFAPQKDGSYKKILQIGNVIIKDDVEIGANTTIDRATLGSTIIGKGVKLDNQIQVAHNVEIGNHTVIAAQTGISGSAKIGKNCAIGGQVGIVGHITIADGTRIGAQSGVSKSITEPNKMWLGSPIMEHKEAMKTIVVQKKLTNIISRIEALEKSEQKL